MATTLEIIQGISQALTYAYDGAHKEGYTDDGEAHSFGLKREEGDPLLDKRVMDGFKVKIQGNKLCINYHSEVKLKEVHDNQFESNLESTINDIAKFLKKEYKKVTGDTFGDVEPVAEASEERLEDSFKKWLSLGKIDRDR